MNETPAGRVGWHSLGVSKLKTGSGDWTDIPRDNLGRSFIGKFKATLIPN